MQFSTMTWLTLIMVAIVVILFLVSLVSALKQKEVSVWVTRFMYYAGVLAACFNLVRVIPMYEDNRGTMIAANVIVLACLIFSYIKMEIVRVHPEPEYDEEEQNEENK